MITPDKPEQEDLDRLRLEIPDAMKAARRWLLWRAEKVEGQDKPRKVPFYSSGNKRNGTLDTPQDRARLDTFDGALGRLATGKYTGLGFALGPDEDGQSWQGIDLDDIAEHPEVAGIVELLPGYIEESPSGLGLHAIGKGSDFPSLGSNQSGVEAYSRARFFTVTGISRGGDIEDLAPFVQRTLAPLHRGSKINGSGSPEEPAAHDLDDQQKADLREALFSLNADDYDDWIRRGLALKGLGAFGHDLWLEWSSTSDKYTPEKAEEKWAGFHPKSTSYRSIFAEAQRKGWKNPQAGAWRQESDDPGSDEDYTTPPPEPRETMFYGLVGDFADAGSAGREVSPVSVGLAFITWLSAHVGRDTFVPIGDVRHPIVINGLHTGRTMVAAKSESTALVRRVEYSIRGGSMFDVTPLLGQCHTGGLSTSEGLALLVHDEYRDGKEEIPGIDDKRLWVYEPEFGGLLEKMKREGNALSATLRDVYDGGSIRPATKTSRLWATSPHIAIHATITPTELRLKMDENSIHNGLANRFLVAWAERTCFVPLPAPTHTFMVEALAKGVRSVLTFALGSYPEERYKRTIELSPEAREMYAAAYPGLRARDPGGETVTALLERRAPITMRLAALFALTDLTTTIAPQHLEAALAWSEYHRDSVRFVFGGDADQRQRARNMADRRERVIATLRNAGDWLGRSEIVRQGFRNHIRAQELTEVLQSLLADREIELREESNPNNPGRKTLYRIPGAKTAKTAKTGETQGLHGFREGAKTGENRGEVRA